MNKFNKLIKNIGLASMLCVLSSASSVFALTPLNDEALSNETGQAAFFTNYVAPSGASGGTTDFGFFTLGLNGTVQLNANIQHLQLGCGGVNGPGCDIDIKNASLSGNPGVGTCPAGASPASCDAVLSNPFIQLAIRNPTSLSTRQLAGFNLGAQQAIGLLQTGLQPNGVPSSTPNGINTISGYLQVESVAGNSALTGTVATSPGLMAVCDNVSGCTNAAQAGTDIPYQINGVLNAPLGAAASFKLNSGGFYIPGFTGVNFSVAGPTILNGNRVSQLTVVPTVTLPNLYLGFNTDDNDCGGGGSACKLSPGPTQGANYPTNNGVSYPAAGGSVGTQGGPANAITTGCSGAACGALCLFDGFKCGVGDQYTVHMYGLVTNIKAVVTFNQPLGYMHYLPINSPLSLSLQNQSIQWPGTPAGDIAQKGWWLTMNDPVILGNLVPSSAVNLCSNAASASTCAYSQIATAVNSYIASNPPSTGDLGTVLFGGTLGVQISTNANPLNLGGSPISLTLNGLQLNSQFTKPNCYGTLKFC